MTSTTSKLHSPLFGAFLLAAQLTAPAGHATQLDDYDNKKEPEIEFYSDMELDVYSDEDTRSNVVTKKRKPTSFSRQLSFKQNDYFPSSGKKQPKRRRKVSARRVIEEMYETHKTLVLKDGGRAAKALKTYIPPRVSRFPISDVNNPEQLKRLRPLHDQMLEFVKKGQEPMLTLFGPGGAGKSSYGRYLENYLWEEYMEDRSVLVPLFIPLTRVYFRKDRLPLIEEYLTEDFGLEEEELEAVRKKNVPFVVILDGYEELGRPVNLYETEDLQKWGARTIITSRAEVLDDPKGVNQFVVEREEALQLHMGPLLPKDVNAYAHRFAKSDLNPTDNQWDGKTFLQRLEQLKKVTGKHGLPTHHPLALRVLLTVLPQLPRQATGLEVYQAFVDAWLREEARRVRQMIKRRNGNSNEVNDNEVDHMLVKFHNYAQALALAMFNRGVEVVQSRESLQQAHPVWGRFFKRENRAEQEGSPIMRVGRYNYRFISAAVQKVFVAQHLLDRMRTQNKQDGNQDNQKNQNNQENNNEEQEQVNLNDDDEEDEKEEKEEKEDDDQEFDQEIYREDIDGKTALLLQSDLSKRMLGDEPIIVRFLGEAVAKDWGLKGALRQLIRRHKGAGEHTIAVANAMMILNAAGVSFARQNLSGLCLAVRNQNIMDKDDKNAWRGACLPGIDLTETNLRGSDLRCCKLLNASLERADMRGALLNNANLRGAKLSNLMVDMDTECDGVEGYNEFCQLHRLVTRKMRDSVRGLAGTVTQQGTQLQSQNNQIQQLQLVVNNQVSQLGNLRGQVGNLEQSDVRKCLLYRLQKIYEAMLIIQRNSQGVADGTILRIKVSKIDHSSKYNLSKKPFDWFNITRTTKNFNNDYIVGENLIPCTIRYCICGCDYSLHNTVIKIMSSVLAAYENAFLNPGGTHSLHSALNIISNQMKKNEINTFLNRLRQSIYSTAYSYKYGYDYNMFTKNIRLTKIVDSFNKIKALSSNLPRLDDEVDDGEERKEDN